MSKTEKKTASKTNAARDLILKNLAGVARLGASDETPGFWSTGHFTLDFAITQGTLPVNCDLSKIENFDAAEPGGIPKGMVAEVYGEPGGGKSSLCLRVVGNAQKRGALCVWVDREQSFVKSLARINGVDTDNLIMIDDASLSAEQVFFHIYKVIESGADVIVVDSVAALIPQRVMDNTDPEQQNVALLARVMGQCIPKLTSLAKKHGCTVIFINQVRQKPGVTYGDPTTTPGGDTLKFMSSVRLQINKRFSKDAEIYREDENGVEQLIAQESLVFIRKTRFSKGLRQGVQVPIYFANYFPNPEQVAFDIGRQTQVIRVRNGIFSFKHGDTKVEAEGRKAFIDEIVSSKLLSSLIADIKTEAADKGIVLPPELMMYEVVDDKSVIKKEAKQTAESAIIEEYLEQQAADDEKKLSVEPEVNASTPPRPSTKRVGKVRAGSSLE
jgi:protein RecA